MPAIYLNGEFHDIAPEGESIDSLYEIMADYIQETTGAYPDGDNAVLSVERDTDGDWDCWYE